jgi:hypothetical protein
MEINEGVSKEVNGARRVDIWDDGMGWRED